MPRVGDIRRFITACRGSDTGILRCLSSCAYYRMIGKSILRSNRVLIRGVHRIETGGLVQIGMGYCGFVNKHDRTYLNVNGRLVFRGKFSIGKGCRFDIGDGATAEFGEGYVNVNTLIVVMHGLTVGEGCAISWGCQILDKNFHRITFSSQRPKEDAIKIGNHVWIGSNVTILRGTVIPDGCVVAAGSVVTKAFEGQRALIAGNPATVIKEDITWQ
jgi:acetyltransferase-like isoleucine patch superfamily enzyme